jgi:hypothetical protein
LNDSRKNDYECGFLILVLFKDEVKNPAIGSRIIPWAQAEGQMGIIEENVDTNCVVAQNWMGTSNQLWFLQFVSGEELDAKYQVVNKETGRCLMNVA